jgi:hypothetical protein
MTIRFSWWIPALVALPLDALAQPTQDDKAAAEALYEAGKTLLRTDVSAACDKFAASQELDPGVGTLLYLGACYERLGRVASAWAAFREAASYAHRSGQADRERTATERAARVEPRVPKLVIEVGTESVAGLEVRRDQKTVASAMLGVPIPLDPGSHTITADAPGKATWSATIDLVEGENKTVQIPQLGSDAVGPAASPLAPAPAALAANPTARAQPVASPPEPANPPKTPTSSPFTTTRGRAGFAIGSVGVATLAVGAYFGLRASSKWSEAKEHCVNLACDRPGIDLRDEAAFSGNVSTALVAVGAAAAATGVVLILTAPTGKGPMRVGVVATPHFAMLSVGGSL